jgi:hypothetical protein
MESNSAHLGVEELRVLVLHNVRGQGDLGREQSAMNRGENVNLEVRIKSIYTPFIGNINAIRDI